LPGPLCEVHLLNGHPFGAVASFPSQAVVQRRDCQQRDHAPVADEGFHADWRVGRKQKRGAGNEGAENYRQGDDVVFHRFVFGLSARGGFDVGEYTASNSIVEIATSYCFHRNRLWN